MSPTPKISGSIICKTNKQWIYFSTTLTPSHFRRYDECWITGIYCSTIRSHILHAQLSLFGKLT